MFHTPFTSLLSMFSVTHIFSCLRCIFSETTLRRVHGDRITDFLKLCEIKVSLCTKKSDKGIRPTIQEHSRKLR